MARRNVITAELLVNAYVQGVFPMARSRRGRIDWFSPDPRGVLPLDAFRVPKSLGRRVRSGRFTIRMDTAFEQVIRACAEPRAYQKETWINDQIIAAYTQLHRLGLAHSVEAWRTEEAETRGGEVEKEIRGHGDAGTRRDGDADDGTRTSGGRLVGGLYGVALGGAFFGESMFSVETDASKVCLVHLVEHLRSRGYGLLDIQMVSPHTTQFGAVEIPREEYLSRLNAALELRVAW